MLPLIIAAVVLTTTVTIFTAGLDQTPHLQTGSPTAAETEMPTLSPTAMPTTPEPTLAPTA